MFLLHSAVHFLDQVYTSPVTSLLKAASRLVSEILPPKSGANF